MKLNFFYKITYNRKKEGRVPLEMFKFTAVLDNCGHCLKLQKCVFNNCIPQN